MINRARWCAELALLVAWALLLAMDCESRPWGLAFRRADLGPDFRLFVPGDGAGGVDWKKARVTGLPMCKKDAPCGGAWERE